MCQWRRKGVCVDVDWLVSLFFADDQVVLARSRNDLESMVRNLAEVYCIWGLKINFSKTEYLAIGRHPQEDLKIGDQVCSKVPEFMYLGSILSKECTSGPDIRRRTEQARKVVRMLHPVLWNNYISSSNKRRIFSSIVESILTYGSEMWTITRQSHSMLQAVEMDFWRRCLRVTRLDKVRNEDIRSQMGVHERLNMRIGRRRLRWYGHCRRMPEYRWPRRALEWEPPGRRGRGRPRRTWLEEVEEEMAGRGLREGDWEVRDYWHQMLTEAGNP